MQVSPGSVDPDKVRLVTHLAESTAERLGLPTPSVKWFRRVQPTSLGFYQQFGTLFIDRSELSGKTRRTDRNTIWVNTESVELSQTVCHEVVHLSQFRTRWLFDRPQVSDAELEREAEALAIGSPLASRVLPGARV